MNCRACAGMLSPWGAVSDIPLLKCAGCGSIHADCAKPADDLYANIYSKELALPPAVIESLRQVVRTMEPYRKTSRWLDIGFGHGSLLDAAASLGWKCVGTEYSEVAQDLGRRHGFEVHRDSSVLEAGSFDVVSLVELVEHVEAPAAFLVEARRLLRPGGCLYITTPNAWSVNRWWLKDRWTVFGPPDHITIFTPPGLHRMLGDAGFENVDLRTEGLNPFEIVRSFKREKKRVEAISRVNAAQSLCESFSSSPGRRRLKAAVNAGLRLTRLGDSSKIRAS